MSAAEKLNGESARADMRARALPRGTEVVIGLEHGAELRTRTRSAPFELFGTTVVFVEGERAPFAIDRVLPAAIVSTTPSCSSAAASSPKPASPRRRSVARRPLVETDLRPGFGLRPSPTSEPSTPASRDAARSRRKRSVRPKTVSAVRMTKRELEIGALLYPVEEHDGTSRPRARSECKDGPRPCPFVSCRNHLYLDVNPKSGAIKLNFPDVDVDELERLPDTCSLDVADDPAGATLEAVAERMNMTRERVRQIEVKGLAKLHAAIDHDAAGAFATLAEEGFDVKRVPRAAGVGVGAAKRRLPVLQDDEDQRDEDDASDDEDAELDAGDGFDVDHFAGDALAE